jgi:ABC-type polysaccharide/polyol phosphate transport system ATPase subunit
MNGGSTVIYVSHDVEGLGRMCNRVIWLDKGKVKMIGEASKVCGDFIASI